ncbi:DUF5602 domain-containing protein [Allomeiothermus silvanus]|uniref:DUF5602 domain-containing protein n=1 Tax=Allomeiothermus silvanus TaxID=52022 RepID=UPI0023F229B4|nr:DUF5602 domain-containing protein [Allomeiothermus silvanus]
MQAYSKRLIPLVGAGVLASLGLLAIGLAQQTVAGPSAMLYGAKVSSWAKLGANGQVMEAGVTIPLSGIEKAPAADPNHQGMNMQMGPEVNLEFPDAVKKATFLDHMELWWEPLGHPPDRYLTPHFDFHFFGLSASETKTIDCKNLTAPTLDLTPQGYAPAVPPQAKPEEFCVPLMGFHALPLSEFAAPGQLKPGLFDQVMIAGAYASKFAFVEPMIARELLLKKQNLSMSVPRPPVLGRRTLYPTQFNATYDSASNAYQFVFSGFTMTDK